MASIEELIESASHDMFNPKLNFEIAKKYDELNQTASAISFYLRAAEYGYDTHPIIAYSSLLRMAACFEDQKDRNLTVSNALQQAIAHVPTRPEAYFLLARFTERNQSWQECYTLAEIGLLFAHHRMDPLPIDVEYPGAYGLVFEKAVSAWWIGRKDESVELFEDLLTQDISESYKAIITYNLEKIRSGNV